MGTNHDSFVTAEVIDDSITVPEAPATELGFSYLQPFFASRGIGNVITRFQSPGVFDLEYGEDASKKVNKFGIAGLMARTVCRGGNILDACRLTASDSVAAGNKLIVSIVAGDVPEWTVNADGDYVYTDDTNTIHAIGSITTIEPVWSVDGDGVPLVDGDGDPIQATEMIGNPAVETLVTKEVVTATTVAGVTVSLKIVAADYTVLANEYELFKVTAKGTGAYGNDIGFTIAPSERRDGKMQDGRRYTITFHEKTPKGTVVALGDAFETIDFSFNPEALLVPGAGSLESLKASFEEYAIKYSMPIALEVFEDSFEDIVEALDAYDATPEMVDFINCKDIDGKEYSKIRLDDGSTDIVTEVADLINGTDGSLDAVWALANIATVTTAVEAKTYVLATREDLLKKFFMGQIDKRLFDARIIDAGIILDAWFPDSVKKILGSIMQVQVRDDIAVYLDLGPNAKDLTTANAMVAALTPNVLSAYGNVYINYHNGMTTNLSRNVRVSGNYEMATGIKRCWRSFGNFTVHAGYDAGKVYTMKMDYLPGVVKGNLEIKPLKDNHLLFATQLFREDEAYYMSDDSQYVAEYSVLGSTRNTIYLGEVIRTCRKVLVKYAFHPENASGAIKGAKDELKKVFGSDYFPSFIGLKTKIFQTKNDKIENMASVAITLEFPDVVGGFNVVIRTQRQQS